MRQSEYPGVAKLGIALAIIQEILGHTDYNTTMGYTHINRGSIIEAVDQIDSNADSNRKQ